MRNDAKVHSIANEGFLVVGCNPVDGNTVSDNECCIVSVVGISGNDVFRYVFAVVAQSRGNGCGSGFTVFHFHSGADPTLALVPLAPQLARSPAEKRVRICFFECQCC